MRMPRMRAQACQDVTEGEDMTTLDGITIQVDNTDAVVEGIERAIMKSLEEIGLRAEGHAKDMAPVDTGRLRNSITHAVDEGEQAAYIGSNVSYAEMQELGTSRMPAANGGKGYLRPAATEHADEYRQILEKNLKGA